MFPQLEIFKIYFSFHGISWEETRKFLYKAWNRMCNLKQLEVNTGRSYNGNDSLLALINIINALPNLQRFVVEVILHFATSFQLQLLVVVYIYMCVRI